MELAYIIAGFIVLALVGRTIHARVNRKPPQTHVDAKPSETHDAKELVGSGMEGYGIH